MTPARSRRVPSRTAGLLPAVLALLVLALSSCGGTPPQPALRSAAPRPGPAPAPPVALTAQDRAVWTAPPGRGRRRVPVLLYHGIDRRAGFALAADAYYAVTRESFAKQMALLHHAGYRAITLEQFLRFHAGERVHLPAHPFLLTFDDGRADSWRGADAVLARYRRTAVAFVDTGAIARRAPEYVDWDELARMQGSGRWNVQLHAGRGHHNIRYGAGRRDSGPFYAYRDGLHGETLAAWRARVDTDLDWGQAQLRRYVPGYRPLAFAPPFGAYGQLATNDPAIPRLLRADLARRFPLVFTQEHARAATPHERDVPRFQLDRTITGGALHSWLAA